MKSGLLQKNAYELNIRFDQINSLTVIDNPSPSQLRVVKGRLETPDELGTFISDPLLEKYQAQQRILLWYDMNEDMSSDTVSLCFNGCHDNFTIIFSLRCGPNIIDEAIFVNFSRYINPPQ